MRMTVSVYCLADTSRGQVDEAAVKKTWIYNVEVLLISGVHK